MFPVDKRWGADGLSDILRGDVRMEMSCIRSISRGADQGSGQWTV